MIVDQIVNALPLVALGRLTIKIGLAMLTPLHAAHGCEWYALLGTKLSCAPSPRSIVLMLIASTVRTYVPAPSLDGRRGRIRGWPAPLCRRCVKGGLLSLARLGAHRHAHPGRRPFQNPTFLLALAIIDVGAFTPIHPGSGVVIAVARGAWLAHPFRVRRRLCLPGWSTSSLAYFGLVPAAEWVNSPTDAGQSSSSSRS